MRGKILGGGWAGGPNSAGDGLRGGPAALRHRVDTQAHLERECAMKLNSAQVERTLSQFQGEAIPDNHPAVPQLNNVFGEHTFFLDRNGLSIVEPASAAGGGS